MRLSLYFIISALSAACLYGFTQEPEARRETIIKCALRDVTSADSLCRQIMAKRHILFWNGHHGQNYSLVFDNDSNYVVMARSNGSNVVRSDTIRRDAELLRWAMDSLIAKAADMIPVKRDYYATIYRELIVHTSDNAEFYMPYDIISFAGADSVSFNKKLGRLQYFMLWYAANDDFREFAPRPSPDFSPLQMP